MTTWVYCHTNCFQKLDIYSLDKSKYETRCLVTAQWRVLVCEPTGCWFDSQSGHMPGLQARSPDGGVQEATTH